ncbi:DUF1641 domain-containing protein [Brevibacillus choshinensis]|uniref:DUF1641 domain-containing protein n=1 Tax=Brevibacillus choshinensis TaxID=54911 RepID=UPI0006EBE29B|nr:DUF1641 domain-containing protein [Brevibacillus choshinensis]
MNEIKEPKSMDMGLEELADPEVQEAIAVLIRKLPRIKDAVLAAEQGVDLATSILQDKESLGSLFDRLGQKCAPYRVEKESILALFSLLEKMPKLLKYVNTIEQVADFVESVGQDKQSQEYLLKGMKGYIAPVTAQVETGVAVFREAKERAKNNHEAISIFGLLRLLKDPTVQKTLRFTQSLLEVLAEKSSK